MTNLKESGAVYLDGSTLEGGGQLVRNAIALSALTSIPITVSRIRASGRGKPGLKTSHAAAIEFLAEMCGAEVTGGDVGSSTLTFSPRSLESIDTDEGASLKSARSSNEQGNCVKARSTEVDVATKFQFLTLGHPQGYMKSGYSIRLSTPGSIFLIFQALYPYLLTTDSHSHDQPLKLDVTGGTNVSYAPSYDYIAQVFIPNFRKLGFPNLSVNLHSRCWSTGPMNLGTVTFTVHPLRSSLAATSLMREPSTEESNLNDETTTKGHHNNLTNTTPNPNRTTRHIPRFPPVNLNCHERGAVTQVDITVLAPDISIGCQRETFDQRQAAHFTAEDLRPGFLDNYKEDGEPTTARKFLEVETYRSVFRALNRCTMARDPGFDLSSQTEQSSVPITVHTSEVTYHRTHMYLLLVAHTSNGFRLGADALFDGQKRKGVERTTGRHSSKVKGGSKSRASAHSSDEGDLILTLRDLVDRCVTKFVEEIEHGLPGNETDRLPSQESKLRKPCVDVFLRDQLVIFEALGRSQNHGQSKQPICALDEDQKEDERYWSLHTKTAMWVCEKILGV
jgi:RNA 3'-terminal phosphate cyclase (ATP)